MLRSFLVRIRSRPTMFSTFRKQILFERRRQWTNQCFASSSTTKTSVSEQEVTKFSEMAKEWWDVRHNPLIAMNPVRISYVLDVVKQHTRRQRTEEIISSDTNDLEQTTTTSAQQCGPLAGFKVLDIGCGGGLLSESLARLGAEVTAIDPSVTIANTAREHSMESLDSRLSNINYRGGVSVEELALEYNSADTGDNSKLFDVICVLEVIEHATNPEQLLAAASSLLKKPVPADNNHPDDGGLLFVSTINRTPKSYALAILGAEYVVGLLPVGTHDWSKFMTPAEVETILKNVDGFDGGGLTTCEPVQGMIPRLDIFSQTMQWGLNPHDTDVNWIGSYSHNSGKKIVGVQAATPNS